MKKCAESGLRAASGPAAGAGRARRRGRGTARASGRPDHPLAAPRPADYPGLPLLPTALPAPRGTASSASAAVSAPPVFPVPSGPHPAPRLPAALGWGMEQRRAPLYPCTATGRLSWEPALRHSGFVAPLRRAGGTFWALPHPCELTCPLKGNKQRNTAALI